MVPNKHLMPVALIIKHWKSSHNVFFFFFLYHIWMQLDGLSDITVKFSNTSHLAWHMINNLDSSVEVQKLE